MKTIEVTDKDYEVLMELSKELQTQTNNGQAFPYFWEPASYKQEVNIHGEGEDTEVYYDGESYSLQEFAEDFPIHYISFLEDEGQYVDKEDKYNNYEYHKLLEGRWQDYIEYYVDDADVWTLDWKHTCDHNPSLFLSDVEQYVKYNQHHLGKDLHTYSRTIQRMPNMTRLIECLLRMNNTIEEENINHEALVYKRRGEEIQ